MGIRSILRGGKNAGRGDNPNQKPPAPGTPGGPPVRPFAQRPSGPPPTRTPAPQAPTGTDPRAYKDKWNLPHGASITASQHDALDSPEAKHRAALTAHDYAIHAATETMKTARKGSEEYKKASSSLERNRSERDARVAQWKSPESIDERVAWEKESTQRHRDEKRRNG